MKQLRIYVDTSVIGGCFDEEFQKESQDLLAMAADGRSCLLISQILVDEVASAPAEVQDLIRNLPEGIVEIVQVTDEAFDLRDAYIKNEVVTENHRNDALHVAVATVCRADMIVSWNFRHIVHFDKIRGFNAVNLREGYMPIEIHSPKEVV